MKLPRRLMNLIVENRLPGAKSMSCVDLRNQLFFNAIPPKTSMGDGSGTTGLQGNTTQTPAAEAINQKNKLVKGAASTMMQRIQLPSPIYTFQASASVPNEPCKMDCFPLENGKMIWTDHLGRSFLYNSETDFVELLPNLHKPKWMPFSLFVPNADADDNYEQDCCGSSLFIMERNPAPEAVSDMPQSYQFEAFVYRMATVTSDSKAWVCQLLPPPPFVREPMFWPIRPVISSYAVVGSGKHICISVDDVGSYCLNTEDHTWSKVGKWVLPFHGKAEYVPEFNLWFGFSSYDRQLAAADLSAMDSQPRIVRTSKQHDVPEEWKEYKDPQLVNLGSGRFCIIRFFKTGTLNRDSGDDSCQIFTVFTGVEVLLPVGGDSGNTSISGKDVELQMISHRSICHIDNGTSIDAVF